MCCILAAAPLDLVDLFLDFQRFEVVEFWLMALKFSVKFVFAAFLLSKIGSSEQHNAEHKRQKKR